MVLKRILTIQNGIERPASIRAAISMVKLLSQFKKGRRKITKAQFEKVALLVIPEGIKPKPGYNNFELAHKVLQTVEW